MTDESLRVALVNLIPNRQEGDAFFGKFQYVKDLIEGNYSACLNNGLALLAKCQGLAPEAYETIHKATPYYWLGNAAFQVHDYQTATFFYDAGVSEDLRMGADPVRNPTPALHFIQIEPDPENQAARPLVKATESRIEKAIADYNGRP